MRRKLEVVIRSLALMVTLVAVAFVLVAAVPRRIPRGIQTPDEAAREYFDAQDAYRQVTPNGAWRLVVTVDKIDRDSLVAKCKILREHNRIRSLIVTFVSPDLTVEIVVDEAGDAYLE